MSDTPQISERGAELMNAWYDRVYEAGYCHGEKGSDERDIIAEKAEDMLIAYIARLEHVAEVARQAKTWADDASSGAADMYPTLLRIYRELAAALEEVEG